jgi:hypothetical protein
VLPCCIGISVPLFFLLSSLPGIPFSSMLLPSSSSLAFRKGGDRTQVVECLLSRHAVPEFKLHYLQNKTKKQS